MSAERLNLSANDGLPVKSFRPDVHEVWLTAAPLDGEEPQLITLRFPTIAMAEAAAEKLRAVIADLDTIPAAYEPEPHKHDVRIVRYTRALSITAQCAICGEELASFRSSGKEHWALSARAKEGGYPTILDMLQAELEDKVIA